ncbi:hypothetical protein MLD38_016759 [Melastoma candidum]|uniref:Uncharacterized protein n=1 Tax=Melastoma candidum TaxID=119954 RepID=A0ACB9QMU8_9MYRT|nr:hypothetical protein MLD38_016759 [Melastoma candidum]
MLPSTPLPGVSSVNHHCCRLHLFDQSRLADAMTSGLSSPSSLKSRSSIRIKHRTPVTSHRPPFRDSFQIRRHPSGKSPWHPRSVRVRPLLSSPRKTFSDPGNSDPQIWRSTVANLQPQVFPILATTYNSAPGS